MVGIILRIVKTKAKHVANLCIKTPLGDCLILLLHSLQSELFRLQIFQAWTSLGRLILMSKFTYCPKRRKNTRRRCTAKRSIQSLTRRSHLRFVSTVFIHFHFGKYIFDKGVFIDFQYFCCQLLFAGNEQTYRTRMIELKVRISTRIKESGTGNVLK